ncbi:MAG: hypothetical protein VYA78_07650, partial [Chloroflexota bacterium]|nr:hypothetical protein [Chloroflexota bacterium]
AENYQHYGYPEPEGNPAVAKGQDGPNACFYGETKIQANRQTHSQYEQRFQQWLMNSVSERLY